MEAYYEYEPDNSYGPVAISVIISLISPSRFPLNTFCLGSYLSSITLKQLTRVWKVRVKLSSTTNDVEDLSLLLNRFYNSSI